MDYFNTLSVVTENLLSPTHNMPITGKLQIPFFGREDLADIFRKLNFKVGAEIGVRGGDYSDILCMKIPGLKLYAVDPYEPHEGYKDIQKRSTFDKYMEEAYKKLESFDVEFMREYSVDAVEKFLDESLDFVYIDGDHSYKSVVDDITLWSKKVKKGGIVSGDDYIDYKGEGRTHVFQAVNGYVDAWGIDPLFVLNGVDGDDSSRTWFYIKK